VHDKLHAAAVVEEPFQYKILLEGITPEQSLRRINNLFAPERNPYFVSQQLVPVPDSQTT
jgi:hypothetical protein